MIKRNFTQLRMKDSYQIILNHFFTKMWFLTYLFQFCSKLPKNFEVREIQREEKFINNQVN